MHVMYGLERGAHRCGLLKCAIALVCYFKNITFDWVIISQQIQQIPHMRNTYFCKAFRTVGIVK